MQRLDIDRLIASPEAPRDAILQALDEMDAPPEARAEAAQLVEQLDRAGLLLGRGLRELPLEENPALDTERRRMTAVAIAELAGFDEERSDALLNALGRDAILTPATFPRLAEDRALGREAAERFAATADAVTLADGHVGLATELLRRTTRGAGGAQGPAALAGLSVEDWKESVVSARTAVPDGLSVGAYAAKLKKRVEAFFPTDAFRARTPPHDPGAIARSLSTLAPLLARNPETVRGRFEELDLRGVMDTVERLRTAHDHLARLAGLSPGLGLEEIVKSGAAPERKAREVAARLALVDRIAELNPSVEFIGVNYAKGSEDLGRLNTGELRPEELRMVFSTLKARQRMFALTRDVGAATDVMAAGYHSAHGIARVPVESFARQTGLAPELARDIHHSAKAVAMGVAGTIGAMFEVLPNFSPGERLP